MGGVAVKSNAAHTGYTSIFIGFDKPPHYPCTNRINAWASSKVLSFAVYM